jgi:dipeptidyl aminopeptidase/acylaminoacyl peptidase
LPIPFDQQSIRLDDSQPSLPMRLGRLLIALLLASRLPAAELIPVEKFAAGAQFSQPKLSPDGNFIAYVKEIDGFRWLTLLDLETRKSTKYDSGTRITGEHREVTWFRWVSNTRIAYLTTVWDGWVITGMSALDRDGGHWVHFAGPDADPHNAFPLMTWDIIHDFRDESASVLVLGRGAGEGRDLVYPDVIKVSTLGGTQRKVVTNPGNVVDWVADRAGAVRLGITLDGLRFGAIYRDDERSPWRTLPLFQKERGQISPLGFDSTGRRLIVVANNDQNRRAVYFYDIGQGKIGELIAGHDRFDIIPEMMHTAIDGVVLDGPVLSDQDGSVLGVNYIAEGPGTQWFDPNFASIQAGIDKILPKTFNLIASHSDDGKRFVVLAISDRDPGTYYLLDLRGGKPLFFQLAKRAPGLPVQDLVPVQPIHYRARDGEEIHGFLTLPAGKKSGVPLVVLPHGGPNVRDVWIYDEWVQFLANRGYGVLQMNYRGSPGYGTAFYEKGRREIGRGMQTDIDDGTRWAIASGIADPARIAIFGASYGGYSALFALAHSPELYRCGISFAGVTDWKELVTEGRGEEYKYAYLYWKDWIGDPETNASFLASISPVYSADRIKAPLLIVQGEDDHVVPPKQARRMVAALEAAGHKPQTLYFPNEGHGLSTERDRARFLSEMEAFLAANLAVPGH